MKPSEIEILEAADLVVNLTDIKSSPEWNLDDIPLQIVDIN